MLVRIVKTDAHDGAEPRTLVAPFVSRWCPDCGAIVDEFPAVAPTTTRPRRLVELEVLVAREAANDDAGDAGDAGAALMRALASGDAVYLRLQRDARGHVSATLLATGDEAPRAGRRREVRGRALANMLHELAVLALGGS
jgi:hypothetical protein